MIPRYAVVISHSPSLALDERHARSTGRLPAYRSNGAIALTSASINKIDLSPTPGLLIGDLYNRHGPTEPLQAIPVTVAQSLADGNLSALISGYWGGYIGFVETPSGTTVFRDPSATFPCYYARTQDCMVFASDVTTLLAMCGINPAIDWCGIGQYLFRFGLPTSETALAGVKELLPGTAMRMGNRSAEIEQIWSPWDFVGMRQNRSRDENIAAVRRVIHACVIAQARRYARPLISVSGGLDSSIVAACLREVATSATALTMYTDDPAGDERNYARILCEALDCELLCHRYILTDVDIDAPCSPHLPRPVGRTQANAYENALIDLAAEHQSDSFFTGNGGDNVFAFSRSAAAVADRILTTGLGKKAWNTLNDISDQTGSSLRQAALATRRTLRNRRSAYRWRPNRRFLHENLVEEFEGIELTHHWLPGPMGALPGQLSHVAGILRVHQSLEPRRSMIAPVVNPLLAQPIQELCLGIPSWQWCAGGRDRSVVRSAFSASLPAEIIGRRAKGTPDSFSAQIIDRFRSGIRERLLDGNLAKKGIVDRESLEMVLREPRISRAEDRPRILDLLDTEAWISHWMARGSASSGAARASVFSFSQ